MLLFFKGTDFLNKCSLPLIADAADSVITCAASYDQTARFARLRQADFDATPLPVGYEVRRRVTDGILAAQFQRDLLKYLAHLFGVAGEE